MITTKRILWSDYLDRDGSRDAYNEYAARISEMIKQNDPGLVKFLHLHDIKTFLFLSMGTLTNKM